MERKIYRMKPFCDSVRFDFQYKDETYFAWLIFPEIRSKYNGWRFTSLDKWLDWRRKNKGGRISPEKDERLRRELFKQLKRDFPGIETTPPEERYKMEKIRKLYKSIIEGKRGYKWLKRS